MMGLRKAQDKWARDLQLRSGLHGQSLGKGGERPAALSVSDLMFQSQGAENARQALCVSQISTHKSITKHWHLLS